MTEIFTLEVCANSVESALAAEYGGAGRVELCDNLIEGGTTPSAGAMQTARQKLQIQVFPIIRPRGGDFCYSQIEFDIMQRDIQTAKDNGCDGVVFGILTPDGQIDMQRNGELVDLAHPMPTTFHRAFDMTRDPLKALDDLIELGLDRILTSGQRNRAIEGVELIAQLVQLSAGRIHIMPGSGVNEENIAEIIKKTNVRECHVSCRKTINSQMTYRNPDVSMGGHPDHSEYEISITDHERILRVVDLANTAIH
jgi:copper homeostasis protein